MRKNKDVLAAYLYILPSFLLICVFSIIPIFMAIYFSFTKYNVMQPPQWVGLGNYARMLSDGFVTAAITNTFWYTVVVVPVQTVLSMVLAAVLASQYQNRYGGFIKSSMFVPVISSSVLVGTLWLFLLMTDGGMINQIIGLFGIPAVNWMGRTQTALLGICMASIWKNVGYYLVIFYAGIMDIPTSLYEAARVDGASALQQFSRITVPMLKPITFLVVILGTIWSFQVFDMVYTMTNGGPGRSTVTLVLVIYTSAFKEFNMGYASAVSLLLLVIILAISGAQRLIFRDQA